MLAEYVKKNVCSKPGLLSRRLRYPNPLQTPSRALRLDLARQKGLGDVLLCTPALRELKRLNPSCSIRFFTDFAPLLRGLPYLDEVHSIQDTPTTVRQLGYEGCTPPRGHLAKIIGDQLGVEVTDIKPDCIVNQDLVESYQALLQAFPKPHIVILRRASLWTPNKDWPNEYWNVVAEKASRLGTVIEIGGATGEVPGAYGSYLDLRAKTTIEQLAALIATADLYIGPVSGPMHIAAATATPAVVIYGGYESPVGYSGYERLSQISLHSPLPCAPCWRTDECPHSRKCLTIIEPIEVLAAASKLLTI
jgi:ADP-heptose:LPS heptosyltransferase